MAGCGMKANPFTGGGGAPGGPTGCGTILGPMRLMSFLDEGRDPT
jgi:hypothetical protein